MLIQKRVALHLSLSIILLYWLYQLFVAKHGGILSSNFRDFVIKVAFTKLLHLTVIVLLLRIEKEGWHGMGFRLNNWKKQIAIGILLGLIMFLFISIGLTTALNTIFGKPAASESILKYFSDPRNLYTWLAIGVLGGGVVEEVMRIFILTRFEKRFNKAGLYFALVCSSIIFGMGHLYQGTGSAISTGIYGLILGGVYIKRRSAIELITIHAFSDILAIFMAYQLASHQYK
jgi:membrane protease YdiL (CAAX protease family)